MTVFLFRLMPEGVDMRGHIKAAVMCFCVPLLMLIGSSARGGEGVDVTITNDGTEDIIVTVYDMNTEPQRVVLTNARINGFTSVPISLVADSGGKARLSWTATSTDAVFPKCGRADTAVGNASSVSVHADSSCGA